MEGDHASAERIIELSAEGIVVYLLCFKLKMDILFKEKLLDDYVAKQPIKPQWTLLNTKSMSFDLLCDLWST